MEVIENKDYPVYLDDIFNELMSFLEVNDYSKVFLLTDENVFKNCVGILNSKTNILADVSIIKIEAGERNKNLKTATSIWNTLILENADRKSLIINFGGGVVSDIGGFIAANFKRGIDFINIPTSLIGMADAAIGGKTAVDIQNFKNQIGLFANPKAVFVFPGFLETLSDEHLVSGYAEVLKYCLIMEDKYWDRIKGEKIKGIDNWLSLIKLSVAVKNKLVQEDFEENSVRKLLNFGHTIGHAIETFALERNIEIPHGNAVAIGMLCEAFISTKVKNLDKSKLAEIVNAVKLNFPKFKIDNNDVKTIVEIMKQDKKNLDGDILFVLLEDIGKANYNNKVEKRLIYESIEYYNSLV